MDIHIHIPHWLLWIGLGVVLGGVATSIVTRIIINREIGRGLGW